MKPRVSQLAQSGATADQAPLWDTTSGLWVPKSVVRPTLVDAKGDLLVGTANDTLSRLGVGSNGQVLTADSAETTGLKWASAGGSLTVQDENGNVATGVTQIDFQGAGVSATSGTGEVIVTISGGGGSATYATRTYARSNFR